MSNEIKDCPNCGQPIPNREFAGQYPGAISRVDNKTEICSDCGVSEALSDHFKNSLNLLWDAMTAPAQSNVRIEKTYTVDVKVRMFVRATSKGEAADIAYEAALGNDPQNLIGQSEVTHIDQTLDVVEGFHSLIEH
jgi:ribosomal protein S27AE